MVAENQFLLSGTNALSSLKGSLQWLGLVTAQEEEASILSWLLLYGVLSSAFFVFSTPRNRHLRPSVYTQVTSVLYSWIGCSTLLSLPLAKHMSGYSIEEPASIFLPLFLQTNAVLLLWELVSRCLPVRWRSKFQRVGIGEAAADLMQRSLLVSAIACVAWAHGGKGCTWRDETHQRFFDSRVWQAARFVVSLFRPLVPESLRVGDAAVFAAVEQAVRDWADGENPLATLWLSCVGICVVNHVCEGAGGGAADVAVGASPGTRRRLSKEALSTSPAAVKTDNRESRRNNLLNLPETPLEADGEHLEMVSWYSMLTSYNMLDFLVFLKLFLGRFDIRAQQANAPWGSLSMLKPSLASPVATGGDDVANESASEPFYYDHSAGHGRAADGSFWWDFMADCGDGFNSSFAIARLLAQPTLSFEDGALTLPRGKLLLIGGDLAYPHPDTSTYRRRFIRTFDYAMPPPNPEEQRDLGHVATKTADKAELQAYDGPLVYAIPGNHDWFDGLSAFTQHIVNASFLGGWRLPQTKSYFALRLPHDWWVFGVDNGLDIEMDADQYRYFHSISSHLSKGASVVVITHDPNWINDDYAGVETNRRLAHLMEHGPLAGHVVARLSGDLHNYTRHVSVGDKTSDKQGSGMGASPQLIVAGGGGAFLHPTHVPSANHVIRRVRGTAGRDFVRTAAYPADAVSRGLAWRNIWRFRVKNIVFDTISACLYYSMVVSAYPLCSCSEGFDVKPLLEVCSTIDGITAGVGCVLNFWTLVAAAFPRVLTASRLSLGLAGALWYALVGFAEMRIGRWNRFWVGTLHFVAHVTAAVACLVFVEVLLETSTESGYLGVDPHRLFHALPWLNSTAGQGGVLGPTIRSSMALADAPNLVAVLRRRTCGLKCAMERTAASSPTPMMATSGEYDDVNLLLAAMARQGIPISHGLRGDAAYATLMYLLISLFAAPVCAAIFGVYLFVSINVLGQHHNESFSALRCEDFKNMLRFRLSPDGDAMEMYAIGIDRVPRRWKRDRMWSGLAAAAPTPSHAWERPSFFEPDVRHRLRRRVMRRKEEEGVVRIVDQVSLRRVLI